MVMELPLHRETLDVTMLEDTLVGMPRPEDTSYERIGVDGRTIGAFGDGG